jgi:hypothetical protein
MLRSMSVAVVPLLDRVVAVLVLGATVGWIALRAFRAWADYRRQRRALDLLVRSMSEIERPAREHRP